MSPTCHAKPTFAPKKSYTGILAALAVLASTAIAQPLPPKIEDKRVAPDVFAIMAWDRIAGNDQVDDLYDAGFNLSGFCSDEMFDYVHEKGMQCFVHDTDIQIRGHEDMSDEEIESRVKRITQRTASHPAVFGYHIIDEPPTSMFPIVSKWMKAFKKAAPEKVPYTNLFPDYGNNAGLGGPFETYLSEFVKQAEPTYWSYDHYAVMDDGSLRPQYFQNLEVAAKVARESGVPFWHVVLANAHFNYTEPTPATMRFQAYTSLAYGARGLGWFTFTARERGNYRNTAVDAYGRRTPTFDMIRDVNLQMHRLAPALNDATHSAVYHTPTVTNGMRGIETSKYLTKINGPGDYVVGEYDHETSGGMVLVVNKSLTKSSSFHPVPKEKSRILKVSSTTGETIPWSAENEWLAPGQGMLLLFEKEED